jgi:hypothetical protein
MVDCMGDILTMWMRSSPYDLSEIEQVEEPFG